MSWRTIDEPHPKRVWLEVAFEDKDKAKSAGAQWSVVKKKWYLDYYSITDSSYLKAESEGWIVHESKNDILLHRPYRFNPGYKFLGLRYIPAKRTLALVDDLPIDAYELVENSRMYASKKTDMNLKKFQSTAATQLSKHARTFAKELIDYGDKVKVAVDCYSTVEPSDVKRILRCLEWAIEKETGVSEGNVGELQSTYMHLLPDSQIPVFKKFPKFKMVPRSGESKRAAEKKQQDYDNIQIQIKERRLLLKNLENHQRDINDRILAERLFIKRLERRLKKKADSV